jgi:transcriptional regulator with XRE-family HTH domain
MARDLLRVAGERIRGLRRAADMTLETLASKADISAKRLGEIERGHGNPTLAYLGRIAAALGVEPFEILLPARTGLDVERFRRKGVYDLLQRLDPAAGSIVSDPAAVFLARRQEPES